MAMLAPGTSVVVGAPLSSTCLSKGNKVCVGILVVLGLCRLLLFVMVFVVARTGPQIRTGSLSTGLLCSQTPDFKGGGRETTIKSAKQFPPILSVWAMRLENYKPRSLGLT